MPAPTRGHLFFAVMSQRSTPPLVRASGVITTERLKVIPPMSQFYPTNPTPSDSRDILPMVRDLYSNHPEYRHHEAWELAHVLFSLGYVEEFLDEAELAAAIEVARTDFDPDEGAA
jgi:hypothetical protein